MTFEVSLKIVSKVLGTTHELSLIKETNFSVRIVINQDRQGIQVSMSNFGLM